MFDMDLIRISEFQKLPSAGRIQELINEYPRSMIIKTSFLPGVQIATPKIQNIPERVRDVCIFPYVKCCGTIFNWEKEI